MESSLFPRAKLVIHTVDALAGSGKTYQAIDYAIRQAELGNKVCIVQPTIQLIRQSAKDIKSRCGDAIPLHEFHSESRHVGESVKGTVVAYLKEPAPEGEIILMTHSAFFSLPYFHNKRDWILICDEIPNVLETFDKSLTDSHSLVTRDIKPLEHDELHYLLRTKRPEDGGTNDVRKIAENRNRDDVLEVIKDLADRVRSRFHQVFVRKEHWERTLIGNTFKGMIKLTCHSVLQPYIFGKFKTVIVMGAMLQDSLMYKLWKNRVDFVTMNEIQSKLRFTTHRVKGSLTIKYFIDGPWSKAFLGKEHQGARILSILADSIAQEFNTQRFIYSANKGITSLFKNLKCERLTGSPHGLNQYQEYDNVAFLSALNPIPATFSFLESKLISDEELADAIMGQSCYQAIMRTSLRNPDAVAHRTIIVPSKKMADWLSEYFDNVNVEQLPNVPDIELSKPGRPKSNNAPCGASRMRSSRRKEMIAEVLRLNKSINDQVTPSNVESDGSNATVPDEKNCDTNAIGSIGISSQEIQQSDLTIFLQFFETVASPPKEDSIVSFGNEEILAQFLEEASKRSIPSKQSNMLISPSTFGDELNSQGERARTLINIKSTWGMWIDIDKGDLIPSDFKLAFPGLRMYIFNTFSGEGRFRVLIPTDCYMTAEAYKDIQQSLLAVVEESLRARQYNKSDSINHGWDLSKMNAASLFYLPCKASTGDADSFFIRVSGDELRVLDWLYRPKHIKPIKKRKSNFSRPAKPVDKNAAEKYLLYSQEYQQVPAGQGLRNDAFFKMAVKLAGLGLNEQQTQDYLISADYDGSRRQKNQIESVLGSLRSYGLFKDKYTETIH